MQNEWKNTYQELKSGIPPFYRWSIALIFIIFFILCVITSCGTTIFPYGEYEVDAKIKEAPVAQQP